MTTSIIPAAGTPRTFGSFSAAAPATAPSTVERVNAQTWLNIGYTAKDANGEDKFVSLPVGIPLDTQKMLDMPRSPAFAQLQAARNDLLEQLQQQANSLEPGEDIVIDAGGGLQIQLRKVSGPAETPAVDDSNPLARKFNFIEPAIAG